MYKGLYNGGVSSAAFCYFHCIVPEMHETPKHDIRLKNVSYGFLMVPEEYISKSLFIITMIHHIVDVLPSEPRSATNLMKRLYAGLLN